MLDIDVNVWYYFLVMNNETHKKIAKIIGESVKGYEWKSWQGGYFHTADGKLVATDGRRIVIVNNQETCDENLFIDKDGDVVDYDSYPNYSQFTTTNGLEIIGEWEINLGRIIDENGWMSVPHTKRLTDYRVLFRSKFIHYRKGIECVANEEDVNLNIFNIRYLADMLRIYRAINNNRTKDMVVKMKFTRNVGHFSSPAYIETVDGKMSYVLMPIIPNCNSQSKISKIINLETKKIF